MQPPDLGPIFHVDHSLTLSEGGQHSLGTTGSVFTRHRHAVRGRPKVEEPGTSVAVAASSVCLSSSLLSKNIADLAARLGPLRSVPTEPVKLFV